MSEFHWGDGVENMGTNSCFEFEFEYHKDVAIKTTGYASSNNGFVQKRRYQITTILYGYAFVSIETNSFMVIGKQLQSISCEVVPQLVVIPTVPSM